MPRTAAQPWVQLKQIASRHRDAGSSSGHGCTAVGREPANPSPFQEMAVTVPRPKQILSLSSVLGLSHRQRASLSLSGVHSHVNTECSPFLRGWLLMSFTFWKLVEWLGYFLICVCIYTHTYSYMPHLTYTDCKEPEQTLWLFFNTYIGSLFEGSKLYPAYSEAGTRGYGYLDG